MKYLLIIIALFTSGLSNAQVHKYRMFQTKFHSMDNPNPPWNNVDILVVVNYDKMTMQIYSDKEQSFDLIRITKDEDKEDTRDISYEAVDQNGQKLEVMFSVFKKPDLDWPLSLVIDYGYQVGFLFAKLRFENP